VIAANAGAKPTFWLPPPLAEASMVRRGSPVRVRERAWLYEGFLAVSSGDEGFLVP